MMSWCSKRSSYFAVTAIWWLLTSVSFGLLIVKHQLFKHEFGNCEYMKLFFCQSSTSSILSCCSTLQWIQHNADSFHSFHIWFIIIMYLRRLCVSFFFFIFDWSGSLILRNNCCSSGPIMCKRKICWDFTNIKLCPWAC